MTSRRSFIQNMTKGGLLLSTGHFPFQLFDKGEITKLCILHTNDVHSRIDPFPNNGGRYAGLGGAAKRAKLISDIRKKEKNVLLLDSGDMFQGTPYFNFFGGELEFKLMSEMKYDVATLGNHDFDAGIDGLHKQLPHVSFDIVSSNYDFTDTVLHEACLPYVIKKIGNLTIGIFGIGIELEGLVPQKLYKKTQYLDPIKTANTTAALLKEKECDYIICLSHLGYKYENASRICDVTFAKNTANIDLILGGHTHTLLDQIDQRENAVGEAVYINQVGWAGIALGKIDIYFENNRKNHCKSCNNLTVN